MLSLASSLISLSSPSHNFSPLSPSRFAIRALLRGHLSGVRGWLPTETLSHFRRWLTQALCDSASTRGDVFIPPGSWVVIKIKPFPLRPQCPRVGELSVNDLTWRSMMALPHLDLTLENTVRTYITYLFIRQLHSKIVVWMKDLQLDVKS